MYSEEGDSCPDGPFRHASLGALDTDKKQPGEDLNNDGFARFLPNLTNEHFRSRFWLGD
jgi:hypothetical protein